MPNICQKDDKVTLDLGNGTTVEGLTVQSIDVSAEDKNSYELTVSIPAKVKKLGSNRYIESGESQQEI